MPHTAELQADYEALNHLILNCPELTELESMLGGFNVFQVLGATNQEIRHSNVLGWLLDPSESHGLDDTFLQRWLMRVLHESENRSGLTPIDIDCWNLHQVDVRREWKHIDVFLKLLMLDGSYWVVCIENKVGSRQHTNQLTRYRKAVENEFPDATHHLFLFLTRDQEEPEDDAYLPASYTQIHRCLKEALQARRNAIGDEPRMLIENYLRLLEEHFMNESEIARLAAKIYQQHKRAFDIIYEQRPDNVQRLSDEIAAAVAQRADAMGIQMEPCSKQHIRFLPKEWDQPGNTHGKAWGGTNRYIMAEIILRGRKPLLTFVSGYSPSEWIDALWERAQQPPFERMRKLKRERNPFWVALHNTRVPIILPDDEDENTTSDIPTQIADWLEAYLQLPEIREVIQIIADSLPELDSIQNRADN